MHRYVIVFDGSVINRVICRGGLCDSLPSKSIVSTPAFHHCFLSGRRHRLVGCSLLFYSKQPHILGLKLEFCGRCDIKVKFNNTTVVKIMFLIDKRMRWAAGERLKVLTANI